MVVVKWVGNCQSGGSIDSPNKISWYTIVVFGPNKMTRCGIPKLDI